MTAVIPSPAVPVYRRAAFPGVAPRTGWIGFVHGKRQVVPWLISYGERWERNPDYPEVSHVFVVVDEDGGIVEALSDGVTRGDLSKYSADPTTTLYFRVPAGWTPEIGAMIASTAVGLIGRPYDYRLLGIMATKFTFFGHALNWLTHGGFEQRMDQAFDDPKTLICSTVGVTSMASVPIYTGVDVLANNLRTIDPQEFFQAGSGLFTPGYYDCSCPETMMS